MTVDDPNTNAMDPFTKFWADAMSGMTAGGTTSPGASPDMMEQMRKTFFSAMAKQADDTMRSEPFLQAMKHSMDNALKFRQQINQFLNQGLQAARMPSRSDTDHIALVVRSMEDRLTAKLNELAERVERLETLRNGAPAETKSKGNPKPRPKR